ncbi:hypothetical protein QYE76_058557 [Lolium multiflorum]|uniref:DUF6598 domain-containing protein n=1 Tax=Lolium multiflorum TaxID=4521 RepID=A0AAD8T7D0_LOLMU|nr:hypothetical protein QYE76_058557 [Lolium multiflorum]
MAADDDEELFLSAYLVDEEEDDAAAAAKAERANRRAAGDWDMQRILEHSAEKQRVLCRKYREQLINKVPAGDEPEEKRAAPPLLPTRHYGACLGGPELASSANVLAVRVTRSAAGYPVDVYGHVFVRDDLDCNRVYIFRRGRHNCQRINSKDEVLTLTGPSRGLLLRRHVHFEINLKSKSRQAEDDRDIARCCLMNDVTTSSSKVVRNRITGRLCMVDLTYAPVHHAVEATVELKFDEILTTTRVSRRGNAIREWVPFSQVQSKEHPKFHGKVIVSITGVPEEIVLYDSKADGTVTAVSDEGFIQLSRCAVSVPICGRLSLKVTTGEHNSTAPPRTHDPPSRAPRSESQPLPYPCCDSLTAGGPELSAPLSAALLSRAYVALWTATASGSSVLVQALSGVLCGDGEVASAHGASVLMWEDRSGKRRPARRTHSCASSPPRLPHEGAQPPCLAWQVTGLASRPRVRPRPVGGRSDLSAGASPVDSTSTPGSPSDAAEHQTRPHSPPLPRRKTIVRWVTIFPSRVQPVILVSALLKAPSERQRHARSSRGFFSMSSSVEFGVCSCGVSSEIKGRREERKPKEREHCLAGRNDDKITHDLGRDGAEELLPHQCPLSSPSAPPAVTAAASSRRICLLGGSHLRVGSSPWSRAGGAAKARKEEEAGQWRLWRAWQLRRGLRWGLGQE